MAEQTMTWKKALKIGAIAIVAVAIAYRIPQVRTIVFSPTTK